MWPARWGSPWPVVAITERCCCPPYRQWWNQSIRGRSFPRRTSHRLGGQREQRELAATIGRRNIEAIRSCTLLAAYLEGQEVDSGTAAEVGYAAALGVRCVGLRSDLRIMGELESAVNLQLEAFILESGGQIVPDLDELVRLLGDLGPSKI